MTNLAANLARTAEQHPDRRAVILDDLVLSYADLEHSVRQLAGWLRAQGVGVGDRVALMLPNVPSFPVLYYAALRLGAVVVPMNPLFKKREIAFYLEDSGAKLLVALPGEDAQVAAVQVGTQLLQIGPEGLSAYVDGEHASDPVLDIVDRAGDDTAVLLYTSGTTGRPKGAELTFDNLQTNLETVNATLLHLGPDDVIMGCLPLFHVFGMTCSMNTAFAVDPADPDAVGEICIRGENIMKGYWQRPEATAEAIDADGWFHTGDLARRDEDGFYFIVDRKKDLIIRGGLNVYPREIEELLNEHEAVAEAAVIGVPHAELGEEIAAYVVLKPGTSASEADLAEHVKSQVAPYKYPRHVHLIDELPRGATGKILKRELREG